MHDQFIIVIVSGVGDETVQKRISTSPVTFEVVFFFNKIIKRTCCKCDKLLTADISRC